MITTHHYLFGPVHTGKALSELSTVTGLSHVNPDPLCQFRSLKTTKTLCVNSAYHRTSQLCAAAVCFCRPLRLRGDRLSPKLTALFLQFCPNSSPAKRKHTPLLHPLCVCVCVCLCVCACARARATLSYNNGILVMLVYALQMSSVICAACGSGPADNRSDPRRTLEQRAPAGREPFMGRLVTCLHHTHTLHFLIMVLPRDTDRWPAK